MVRKHASLDKDAELERAAWVATQGAVVGAAKVSPCAIFLDSKVLIYLSISSGGLSQRLQQPLHTSSAQSIVA